MASPAREALTASRRFSLTASRRPLRRMRVGAGRAAASRKQAGGALNWLPVIAQPERRRRIIDGTS